MSPFTDYLRTRSDDELVDLLRRRPDLATPSPSTLSSLAVRATSRASLERALAGADASVLQVLEAVAALEQDEPVTAERLAAAVGAGTGGDAATAPADDAALVARAVETAVRSALLHPDADDGLHTVPGVADLLGPYPAGLSTAESTTPPDRATTAAAPARAEPDPAPADPAPLDALLAAAPAGARAVLDALTWGPPVGVVPAVGTPAAAAVRWLVAQGLLVRGDAQHVVLPRRVALALRGGRTHREPARPPVPAAPVRPAEVVAAEAASAGERVVRLVARLLRAWEEHPPGVLRSGGLGVRDLRRTAQTLETDEAEAAFVVELAGAAGLVADDGEEHPSFVPTAVADEWTTLDLPERWATLAAVWLAMPRAPWLVGGRDERGGVQAALDPELRRGWAPRLRRSVLDVLGGLPAGAAPTPDDVLALLRWRTPRAAPPAHAVTEVLAEAARIGVLGAGALSEQGRASVPAGGGADDAEARLQAAAGALARGLPAPVDEVLLQGDLTGIVPGRPSPALEDLLDRSARVESRGGALTVRFTPESVRAALDAGSTADELLEALAAHARSGVPQPLEYLVRDAARRHGRLRAGAASSYLRAEDPALLAGLVEDPRLRGLGLVRLAPTVLAAGVPARELLEALREHGSSPVAEGPDGQVLQLAQPERRRAGRVATSAARRRAAELLAAAPSPPVERLRALVPALRRAEDRSRAEDRDRGRSVGRSRADDARDTTTGHDGGVPSPDDPAAGATAPTPTHRGTADPASALLLLREAAAEHLPVWVELVGATGIPERRLLRPLRVEGGRLRAVDPAREAELTVAVHRIATVVPAQAPQDDTDLPGTDP